MESGTCSHSPKRDECKTFARKRLRGRMAGFGRSWPKGRGWRQKVSVAALKSAARPFACYRYNAPDGSKKRTVNGLANLSISGLGSATALTTHGAGLQEQ
jgi:hypothetical protein